MKISLSFVPDGNRRWAKERNKNALFGHTAGTEKIREIINWLNQPESEVDECVFWCLSRSNLSREIEELNGLFFLLKQYLKKFKRELIKNQVAFLALGEITLLPLDIRKLVISLEESTQQFMSQRRIGFGLGYDRDYDLIRATREIVQHYPHITDPKEIEEKIRDFGYAHGMRDPDILIRTGAKKGHRTSGAFMGRETDIYFTETLWPDFSLDTIKKLIEGLKKKEHTHGL